MYFCYLCKSSEIGKNKTPFGDTRNAERKNQNGVLIFWKGVWVCKAKLWCDESWFMFSEKPYLLSLTAFLYFGISDKMYSIEGRSDYRYFLYALNCRLQCVCLVFIIMKQKKRVWLQLSLVSFSLSVGFSFRFISISPCDDAVPRNKHHMFCGNKMIKGYRKRIKPKGIRIFSSLFIMFYFCKRP